MAESTSALPEAPVCSLCPCLGSWPQQEQAVAAWLTLQSTTLAADGPGQLISVCALSTEAWRSCWGRESCCTCQHTHAGRGGKDKLRGVWVQNGAALGRTRAKRAGQEGEAALGLHARRRRREFRTLSCGLRGCAVCLVREGTPQSPTGSEMYSISCSFYLFVLPSISSRALSSLALASYSSSMNSCCRFLPERKNPIVSHLLHRGKDKSDSIFATVKVQKPLCSLSRQHCKLCSWPWCHSAMINQCVLTPKLTLNLPVSS